MSNQAPEDIRNATIPKILANSLFYTNNTKNINNAKKHLKPSTLTNNITEQYPDTHICTFML